MLRTEQPRIWGSFQGGPRDCLVWKIVWTYSGFKIVSSWMGVRSSFQGLYGYDVALIPHHPAPRLRRIGAIIPLIHVVQRCNFILPMYGRPIRRNLKGIFQLRTCEFSRDEFISSVIKILPSSDTWERVDRQTLHKFLHYTALLLWHINNMFFRHICTFLSDWTSSHSRRKQISCRNLSDTVNMQCFYWSPSDVRFKVVTAETSKTAIYRDLTPRTFLAIRVYPSTWIHVSESIVLFYT